MLFSLISKLKIISKCHVAIPEIFLSSFLIWLQLFIEFDPHLPVFLEIESSGK